MGKLINLTPHDLIIFKDGSKTIIPASGKVARVSSVDTPRGDIDGIPVVARGFGDVVDLPAPQDGVIYIVSVMVLSALAGKRDDVVAPDTGAGAVRDDSGRIVGVKGFITNP